MRAGVHFVHGNGFPSPCYKQFLSHLENKYDCSYIDRVGHNRQFPVSDNWHTLVDEVILSVKAQASQPVIAIGHSLGGVLSLIAAIEQPTLFKAVILLDSPLIGRIKSSVIHAAKLFGFIDHVTPAFRTRSRRTHWHDRHDAWSYLKSRELFKSFTDECLNDYIDYGLIRDESGYTLRFDPDIEYQIFRTIPHVLHQYEDRLTVPTTLVYGKNSAVVDSSDRLYMEKNFGIANLETNGSHMFPMEYPHQAASTVLHVLNAMK